MVSAVNGRHNLPTPPPMDYSPAAGSGGLKQIHGALAPYPHHRHMWIITGPAGCGKSTIAAYLSKELSIPYIEGDDVSDTTEEPWILHGVNPADVIFLPQYHPDSNKTKMAAGTPLTDADRWDWLIALREAAAARLSPSKSSTTKPHDGVVVTCSALKRKYRDVIRIAAYDDHDVMVHFIYLRADAAVLLQRVKCRKGHYMKSAMVRSQLEVLESPDAMEQKRDVLEVDCTGNLTNVQKLVVKTVREALADDQ
ncbi:gluconokinase, partial [Lecanoromycetidae sp. Uapishka_2]